MNATVTAPRTSPRGVRLVGLTLLAAALALLLARIVVPERGAADTGWTALANAAFALALLFMVGLIACGAGFRLVGLLRESSETGLEAMLLAEALGLGLVAYGFMTLGFVGLFRGWAFAAWLLTLGLWGARDAWRSLLTIVSEIPRLGARWRAAPVAVRALVVAGLVLLTLAILQGLAPPWDYDGLMYHLQGPRLFLGLGRIGLLPENWQANGPFTVEMLFSLGLSFGSDVFAKLVHVTYAVLLVLATFALGRKTFGTAAGWVSIALLMGVPLFAFWASLAYTDMAWALYQTLMLYCLLRWDDRRERSILVLAGIFAGLAGGSKYLGLVAIVLGGLWLLWKTWSEPKKQALYSAATFGIVSIAVAAPWYVKNWIAAGNPVFPFFLGGGGWDRDRVKLLMDYLGSFGTGHSPLDYALLPWNLFAQSLRFGTFMRALEVPNVLMALALAYPIARRSRDSDSVALMALGGFIAWALGSQQTRFLLPVFPLLSVCAAGVLRRVSDRLGQLRWLLFIGATLAAIPLVVAVFWSGFLTWYARPGAVVLGLESKRMFLSRRVSDFTAIQFVRANLGTSDRVLMMWDGQGYYCDTRCLPDTDQSQWVRLARSDPAPRALAAELRRDGITHLLFSHDSDVFVAEHDPRGLHRQARDYFLAEFAPACTRLMFDSGWVQLYQITCTERSE